MPKRGEKMVIIRLSVAQAKHVQRNVDGWLDAGECAEGLEPDEKAALQSVDDQLARQLRPDLYGRRSSAPGSTGEPLADSLRRLEEGE